MKMRFLSIFFANSASKGDRSAIRSFYTFSCLFVVREKIGGKGFLADFAGIVAIGFLAAFGGKVTFLMSLSSLVTYLLRSVFDYVVSSFAEAFVFGRVVAALESARG